MYSNLSMIMAQEHHRDLLREAKAANLASSVAPASPAKTQSPWLARISFRRSARRPAFKLAVTASERSSAR